MAYGNPRYPLREYYGKYSAWQIHYCSRDSFRDRDKVLERFFSYFPNKEGIEQFSGVDVTDYVYLRVREQKLSASTIKIEVSYISAMWKYLVEMLKLPLFNIAKAHYKHILEDAHKPKKRNSLSIEQMLRLIDCIKDIKVKHEVLDLAVGEKVKFCKNTTRRMRFDEACIEAGLPYVTAEFIRTKLRDRLQIDMINLFVNRVRAELPPRPEKYHVMMETPLNQEGPQGPPTLLQWYQAQNPQ